uniref:Bacteriophage T5 Orf172 DNA-binding domain-containing protein n=1 Tax=Mycena chlorophos TaxID=658473 RepID=A0ABQ0LQJ3_MYCCL|nr:predicted protein [Mycena chlorophos]
MAPSDHTKDKAKQFLHKLFDLEDRPAAANSRPPATPPKPSPAPAPKPNYYGSPTPARPPPDDLVQGFQQMSMNNNPLPNPHPRQDFVGGFHPAHFSPGALPRPPAMPMPVPQTSMTMQYAMQETAEPPSFLNVPGYGSGRPQSLPPPTQQAGSPFLSPQISPAPSASPSASPSTTPTKTKPRPRRSNSAPTVETCAGFTKAGKRCTREVKSRGPAFSYRLTGEDVDVDGNISSEAPVERFCYQHIKDFMSSVSAATGFYARKWMGEGNERGDQVWVSFAEFIPPYLSPETQVALRVEMEKMRSPKDVEGYIYTFEIRDPGSPQIQLKTGRTTHLIRRLDQWSKQCSSKEHVLRGWYPGGVGDDGLPSLMKGRVDAGHKGPACHRLERLIHLELADLVAEGQYLKPGWKPFKRGDPVPAAVIDVDAAAPSTPNKKPAAASLGSGPRCPDCGSQHKEIFTFTRIKKGPLKGKEWEGIVQPVVQRWGQFVEDYVG